METPSGTTSAFWRIAWRIAKWFAVVVLVLIVGFVAAAAYIYTHQDKIKGTITHALNAQLATEISVGTIAIDFFSKFPQVSVKFTNVISQEALPESKQPLFLFKGIYVRFGLWDVLNNDYTIRQLSFDQGEVNLRLLPDGSDNWHFWKEVETTESTTAIALEDVEWTNARFRYADEALDLHLVLAVENVRIKGNFEKNTLDAAVEGSVVIEDITYGKMDLADDVALQTSASLVSNGTSTEINLSELRIGKVELAGQGTVREGGQKWRFSAENTLISDWLPIIPKAYRPQLSQTKLDGRTKANLSLELRETGYELKANATLSEGSFEMPQHHLQFTKGSGNFAFQLSAAGQKSKSSLHVSNLHAQTRTGTLKFDVQIDDLQAPNMRANGSFTLSAQELLAIYRPGMVEDAEGAVAGNFSYAQKFANWEALRSSAFANPVFTGNVSVSKGRVRFANSNVELNDISADIEMRGKDLVINRLFLRESQSEFLLDGWFYNVLHMGANRPTPTLNVRLQSRYVDLDRIMGWQMPKRAANGNSTESSTAPIGINFQLAIDVQRFNFIRFSGTEFKAEIWNDGNAIKGKNIHFSGLGGKVRGAFSWATEAGGYRFWTDADLQRIDIHQGFSAFENFGQNWLLADNIYGTGTARLETSMLFNEDLKFIPASLKLATDITIENGRLVGYKPLMSLSSLVDVKELQDVRFDKLHNQIGIANEIITIPQMEIKSTALDLVVLGRHSFDQQIDYSIRLALADVIKKKKKKKTDLDDWIEEAETTDQPYIWVHVGCTVETPCLSMDREMLKKGAKEEWKKQGEDIRNILKPEPPNAPKPKDPTKGELIFEWEEEEADTIKR